MFEALIENAVMLAENGGAANAIPPQAGAAIGVGLAVGLASIGAGIAERGIGSAAIGAMAEDSLGFGTALLFTVIPETLAILAFVLAFLIPGA